MMRATLLPIVILLIGHTVADIMLPPGYEKKESKLEKQSNQQEPTAEPLETLPQAGVENTLDPGFHVELHPVYSDGYHISADAVKALLQSQYWVPPVSNVNYRHVLPASSAPAVAGVPAPHHQGYLPLPVHNRHKRSTNGDESMASKQRNKRDKDDVATKSTLDNNMFSVVELPSEREEKRVNTRQSSGTLLGLNPSNMYPIQQYRTIQMDPVHIAHQDMAAQQTLSQINSRAVNPESLSVQRQHLSSPMHIALPRGNLGNMQHTMMVQQSAPQQQQLPYPQYRTAIDPRQKPTTFRSSPNEESSTQSDAPMVGAPNQSGMNSDAEMVGTKHKKMKVVQHVHHHTVIEGPAQQQNQGPIIEDEPPMKQPIMQPEEPQVIKYYQVPSVQPSYVPATPYYVIPPTYPANYVANCAYGYSAGPAYSPVKVCLQAVDNMYMV